MGKITIKRDWDKAEIEVFIENEGLGCTAKMDDFIKAFRKNLKIFKTKRNVIKAFEKTCKELKKEIIKA